MRTGGGGELAIPLQNNKIPFLCAAVMNCQIYTPDSAIYSLRSPLRGVYAIYAFDPPTHYSIYIYHCKKLLVVLTTDVFTLVACSQAEESGYEKLILILEDIIKQPEPRSYHNPQNIC